jgi:hypothetical protein
MCLDSEGSKWAAREHAIRRSVRLRDGEQKSSSPALIRVGFLFSVGANDIVGEAVIPSVAVTTEVSYGSIEEARELGVNPFAA